MNKRESAIVDLAVATMRTLIRLGRSPVMTRKGAIKIEAFKKAVADLPSGKPVPKKPQEDVDTIDA